MARLAAPCINGVIKVLIENRSLAGETIKGMSLEDGWGGGGGGSGGSGGGWEEEGGTGKGWGGR